MKSSHALRTAVTVLSALSLGACAEEAGNGSSDSADTSDTAEQASDATGSSDTLAVAETGWLTIGSDGAVQTTFFDTGGRYRDLRNGTLLSQGNWQQRPDGELCFEPDAGLGACWTTSSEEDGGTVIATNGDGKRIEIKRVTYIAPPAPDEEEEGGASG